MSRAFLLICVFTGWNLAQASVTAFDDVATTAVVTVEKAVPDATGHTTINLLLTPGDLPITSLQCDIQYQNQTQPLSESLGPTAAGAGKSLWTSTPAAGTRRILIVGLNATPIGGGIIATLAVQVPAGALSIDYPVVTNLIASDGMGYFVPVQVANVSGPPVVVAVVNAASYATGAIAPGEMVVIWGGYLGAATTTPLQLDSNGLVATSLAGTRVLFDGIPAPLVYTTLNQISAIVPYQVEGSPQTSIQVEYQGMRSVPFVVAVVKSAPGLFTLNASGQGQGAVLNQDGTVNDPANPALKGSIVSVYGTGGGQNVPPCADGKRTDPSDIRQLLVPITGSIGNQSTEVVYAGSAGGQVCSLLQVNLRVPLSLAPGGTVPVRITTTGSSQSGVTMVVQ